MKIAVLAALSSVICVGTSLAGSGNRAVVEVRPGMDVQRTLDEAADGSVVLFKAYQGSNPCLLHLMVDS